MVALYPIAGAKIFIGNRVNAKGTVSPSDFASAVWKEIGGWVNAGGFGDTTQIIEQDTINEGRTRKGKGTRNAGNMENQFLPDATDPGQIAFKAAIDDCKPYQFKIEWGASCPPESEVTITIADPAVISWVGHGLVAGQVVTFATTGTLPTGLVAGTPYYVLSVGLTADAFQVAATVGGTPIETTGAQTGVQSAIASPIGMTDLFFGLALDGTKNGGGANTALLKTYNIAIDSNILEV